MKDEIDVSILNAMFKLNSLGPLGRTPDQLGIKPLRSFILPMADMKLIGEPAGKNIDCIHWSRLRTKSIRKNRIPGIEIILIFLDKVPSLDEMVNEFEDKWSSCCHRNI